jgi:hypothetical protein
MGSDPRAVFDELKFAERRPQAAVPVHDLDELVSEIYTQARTHRDLLIKFYIVYTAILSGLVVLLIFWQAWARFFVHGDSKLELIPQWALNLVVVGMFGQFIGLLTIVTKRVWEFKPFLDHAKKK